ncbi:hypothetical protein IFR05_007317 [Cadophora sp. M221]|nr:hypothetical protein IFR05_007317 [Cadophora sp. M221]
MLQNILMSIILKDVSLEGPPTSTLLPLQMEDVHELNKVRKAIRTFGLKGNVIVHIAKFWMYHLTPGDEKRRQELYRLVKSLFEPYLLPDADKFQHQCEFKVVLDEAAEFGKRVLGRAVDHFELRWGERDDVEWIVTQPAMYAVEYVNKDKPVNELLDRGSAIKEVQMTE